MTGSDYQRLAMRTNDGKSLMRLFVIMNEGRTEIGDILMGCLGLAGESGEFLDIVKKWIFHEKPLDEKHAKKELGDVLWYVAEIAHGFGWDLDEIMQLNINKLRARYPEGFDTELANNRKEGDE